MTLAAYLLIASGITATTYGHGEFNCGDVESPRQCAAGAVTASGESFVPDYPSAAIAAPARLIVRGQWIKLRVDEGPCFAVRLNDKMNPRYIGTRGFDLSPAAVELLTGQPAHPRWSGRVHVCTGDKP
jgi:hypothetical protein